MSIATELSRIQADRNTIRAKLVELGMANNADNLTKLATAIEGLVNRGAVTISVKEGETYTIPAGYHNGAGTVSGVSGGGNYSLQSKTVTPTKKQQSITSDEGYYGLSDVIVNAIPDAYQDVTSVTAGAGDVLTGKVIVNVNGEVITGTMTNNGSASKTLDVTTITYTIPKGYHDGTGKVTIVLEEKTVIPTKATQVVQPVSGKVLSKVTVNPIPDEYITTTDATAAADQILIGETAYVAGEKLEGTMPNIGTQTKVLDTTTGNQAIPISKGFHDGNGEVSIVLETKTATPTKNTQDITPTVGKVLSKVTVNPIPTAYQDVTPVTAEAGDVLVDHDFVSSTGAVVAGAMPNNGSMTKTIDGLTQTSVDVPAGYTSGGKVSLTGDIEEALAAI